MSDDAAGRFAGVNRVSIRAVLARDGEDVSEALLKAGITRPVPIPVALGDGDGEPGGFLGGAGTPNLTGVVELDAPMGSGELTAGAGEEDAAEAPAGISEVGGGRSVSLPPAYGLQPLAPVRRPGSRRYGSRAPG